MGREKDDKSPDDTDLEDSNIPVCHPTENPPEYRHSRRGTTQMKRSTKPKRENHTWAVGVTPPTSTSKDIHERGANLNLQGLKGLIVLMVRFECAPEERRLTLLSFHR